MVMREGQRKRRSGNRDEEIPVHMPISALGGGKGRGHGNQNRGRIMLMIQEPQLPPRIEDMGEDSITYQLAYRREFSRQLDITIQGKTKVLDNFKFIQMEAEENLGAMMDTCRSNNPRHLGRMITAGQHLDRVQVWIKSRERDLRTLT